MPDRPSILGPACALLAASRVRFAITITGISLCVLLMGFLVGIYRGVSDGSVEYVRQSNADVWVLQQGTTNILRGFSLLTKAHGYLLREMPEQCSVSPILFRLSTLQTPSGPATTYLTGFDPSAAAGGPPAVIEGRTIRHRGDIVLDRAFARRWSCGLSDTVTVMGRPFVVTGISSGSNMFAIQYAFAHIDDVRGLYGVTDLVSAFLVKLYEGEDPKVFAHTALLDVPGISAYDRSTFLRQNILEMENGFLPVVLVMMTIGALLLTVIIGLLLTMNVLEHRQEFAVLKAIGSPGYFLPLLVLVQSFLLVAISVALGSVLVIPLSTTVESITPEISIAFAGVDLVRLAVLFFLLVIAGTVLPLLRLRSIYPVEAFR